MTGINRRDILKLLGSVTLSPLVHASAEKRAQARKVYLNTAHIENPIPAAIADQNVAIGAEISEIKPSPELFPAVTMRLYMIVVSP